MAAYCIGVTKVTLEAWASSDSAVLYIKNGEWLARYRIGNIKDYIRRSTVHRRIRVLCVDNKKTVIAR